MKFMQKLNYALNISGFLVGFFYVFMVLGLIYGIGQVLLQIGVKDSEFMILVLGVIGTLGPQIFFVLLIMMICGRLKLEVDLYRLIVLEFGIAEAIGFAFSPILIEGEYESIVVFFMTLIVSFLLSALVSSLLIYFFGNKTIKVEKPKDIIDNE